MSATLHQALGRGYTRRVLTEARTLLVDAGALIARRSVWFAIALLALVTLGLITITYDATWLPWLRVPKNPPVRALARWFSRWGDYHTGTFIVVAAVGIVGLARRSAIMRRAALACLISASCAGLAANLIRSTVGRPRPMAKVPDGAYGPTLKYRYLGFPSAHASTSFGTAVPLVVALPVIGVPTLVFAGGVAWSRMQLRRHHPTDVLIGAALGALVGIPLGLAARRGRRPSLSPASPASG